VNKTMIERRLQKLERTTRGPHSRDVLFLERRDEDGRLCGPQSGAWWHNGRRFEGDPERLARYQVIEVFGTSWPERAEGEA
jgi:hypothetical protein